MDALWNKGWSSQFLQNHDQPRCVSVYGDDGEYRVQSAKMLGTLLHTLPGTPYVYQGEELGMTNAGFTRLDQYRDVESLNHFQILRDKGLSEESVYNILKIHSRDNSRTPMQWTAGENGGFTTGTPWISVNPNTSRINAASQVDDPDSIFAYYKALIRLRKEYDVFAYGDFAPVDQKHPSVLAYRREYKGQSLLCVNNFYRAACNWHCPVPLEGYRVLLSNYSDSTPAADWALRPYESVLLIRESDKD